MRTCRTCHEEKPLEESFYRTPKGVDGFFSTCKKCHNQRVSTRRRERTREDPAAATARNRRTSLRQLYGITPEDFDRMMEDQGGVCRICGNAQEGGNQNAAKLHVDHCHETGKVRGLLCTCCNTALGKFRDDPALLRAAADYLERHGR